MFIQFESSRVKEAEREAIKKTREKILAEAEESYNRKQAEAERARQRGDDKWMLPELDAKLSSGKLKKKKKKEKKEKKSKKSKKKKRKYSTSSSSSSASEDEAGEWVEKNDSAAVSSKVAEEEKLERDEWMNLSGSFFCSSRDKKPKEDKKDTCIVAQPGQSSKELNPYWKNGGTGLPEEKKMKNKPAVMNPEWLKKSLQRAQEQAQEEGRSLEDVAAERWGSLDQIKRMIEEAEINSKPYDKSRYHESDRQRKIECKRSHRDRSRSRSRSRDRYRRNYDDKYDRGHKKPAFKKPDDSNDGSSYHSGSRQSSSSKNWRKLEANERLVRQESNPSSSVDRRSGSADRSSSVDKRPSPVNTRLSAMTSKDYHSTVQSSSSDSEVSEAEEKSPVVPIKVLTDDELNHLGAKLIKAEIMGDMETAAKLKKELEDARGARKNKPQPRQDSRKEENVILTTTNSRGMARPLEPRSKYQEPQGGRRKNKKVESYEGGQRVRYFADDDKYSLQDMFQREKGLSANEDDAAFVKMASKSMDMDELFEERITRGDSDAKQDHRDKMRAIHEHKKREKSLDNCRLCVDSKEMQKHLIVALGSKMYLSLPWHVSLTPGHCIIAPVHHVSSQTLLDEDVWDELKAIKKALTKMFTDSNQCPVFFEVFVGRHRYPHMYLECVPLPEEVGSMAPMYFKKALLECEMEWSTNKKVVDLNKKDVRQAIPKGLPYFAVNFGTQGGFAHVIEDEKLFPRNFAQEIIGGMLDLDSHMWRKPRKENFDQQKKKVIEFAEQWKKYDCTKQK
ncbi:CWF19-like protein 2 [Microplitis mediator]|uniref:CWF19-like protein 2 n=1 Tax=Microplitis mediator TaxID=375433 RepID=UPI002554FB56|nr:CWF19-like protein 2 [Microplitis mediator]